MFLAGVVEGRAAIDLDGHPPPHDPHVADQIVARLALTNIDGHEVQDFSHALR
jgi:hypothetical protein